VLVALLLFFGGPAQVIAGKYVQHCDEFLRIHPQPAIVVPKVLPKEVAALTQLIEGGHATAAVFEALGDALSAQGDSALAFRAYDRAQLLDPQRSVAIQRKKDGCEPVSQNVIERERREARIWVDALQSYERARIENGEDPRDLEVFYQRYGRPEDDLGKIVQGRQLAFWVGALGLTLGAAFLIGSRRLRRRSAALPLALAALCLVGALRGAVMLPYVMAAAALGLSAVALSVRGRKVG